MIRHVENFAKGSGWEVEQHFALSPDQTSQAEPVAHAIDLDRMCDEAMDRLRAGIARHVLDQKWEWRKACADRMWEVAMREACRDAIEKHLGELIRIVSKSIGTLPFTLITNGDKSHNTGATP